MLIHEFFFLLANNFVVLEMIFSPFFIDIEKIIRSLLIVNVVNDFLDYSYLCSPIIKKPLTLSIF